MNSRYIVIYIKWLLKRGIYLKKEFKELRDKLIYQRCSWSLLHKYNAHSNSYQPMLYFNLIGRVIYATKEILALISKDKSFKKTIKLEGYESVDFKKLYNEGSDEILYPKSPYIEIKKREDKIDDEYFTKLQRSFDLALKYDDDINDYNPTWQKAKNDFLDLILDSNKNIDKERLINFRKDSIFEEIITDQFSYVDTNSNYISEYLKAIDLVLEYHRYAKVVKKEILANLSESNAGNNSCIVYRGKRLSEKSIFYALCVNDIITHTNFRGNKTIVCDIGAGYGGLIRELKYYLPKNSCYILVDLPEVILFCSYYIKYNFPEAKIALLDDLLEHKGNFSYLVENYDFIIISPQFLKYVDKESIDLIINTASMSFMSEKNLNEYIEFISRTLKKDAYFYSVNTPDGKKFGGLGTYKWKLKDEYLTIYQGFNNRFAYPQWLGKKV